MIETFKDPKGQDYSLSDICALIDPEHDYEVFVGTDSQVHRKRRQVLYATCIVLYKQGKGGRIFVYKEWMSLANSLRDRLTKEVWRSVEVAFTLKDILPLNAEIVIDIDLNKKPQYKSSNYVQELVGMVVGQDFKCRTKPDAWAAMCVADKYSK